jgi:hypothetical protein
VNQEGLRDLRLFGVHGSLLGFVEVEKLVFGERSSVVLDPGEERIKTEFAGVKRTYLPMHSVLRIDEVRKQGVSKSAPRANVASSPCRYTRAAVVATRVISLTAQRRRRSPAVLMLSCGSPVLAFRPKTLAALRAVPRLPHRAGSCISWTERSYRR